MRKIKIIQVRSGFVSPILIKNGSNSILVDTGRKGFGNDIIKAIETNGLKFSDIKLIILTHTHFDHTGNARYLKEKTGAQILVHKSEATCLKTGYTIIPKGTTPVSKILSWVGRHLFPYIGKYPAVAADIVVSEKFDLSPWGIDGFILHTPGHTDGSLSVIIGKNILAGDMFYNRGTKGIFPPFANNPELLLKSWERIFDLGIETIYPGHGARISIKKVMDEYRSLRSKL